MRFTVDNRNRLIFYGNPVGYVKADTAVVGSAAAASVTVIRDGKAAAGVSVYADDVLLGVTDENGRIDLRDSLDGPAVAERTGRSVGHGHALVDRIAHTVIEVVLAVLVSGVRRVQLAVAVRHFVVRSFRCEGVAMDRPVLQVVRRQQIVSPRAIEVGAFVSRNIKIKPSVLPLVSFRIGGEHAGRYDRILSAQGTSEQGGNREPFLSYHLITGFWLGSFRSGTVFSTKPGFPPRLGRGAVGP